MSYASATNLLAQFDSRVIGDLCNDSGVRQTPTQLLSDPNVAYTLSRASGLISTACLVGQRYTVAELQALSGDDAAALQGLTCDLAFVFLADRRGVTPPQYQETFKRSQEMLEQLKKGERLFNVPGDVAAGVPAERFISVVGYSTVNLLRDATVNRFFPVRRIQNTSSV